MKNLLLGLTISLIMFSCKHKSDDKLCKKWDMGGVNVGGSTGVSDRFIFDYFTTDLSSFHKDCNDYIRFFEDGTMIINDYPKFEVGTWKRIDKDVDCKFKNQSFKFTVTKLTDDSLVFTYDTLQKKSGSFPFFEIFALAKDFRADNQDFSEDEFDPFSTKNNTWRLKPSKGESKEEVKKRAINHIDFLIAYHNYAVNKGGVVSFTCMHSPFTMTQEGISFRNDDDSASWKSCFFDNNDANLGFFFMDEAFHKVKPNENKDEKNIVKYSLDYLIKMRKELK